MAGDDGELPILSSNNDDIIVEILSWLPVVSLLRFRCVCKSWRALITTPQFVAKHRAHTNDSNKNVLILTKPYWPPPAPPPPPSVSPLLIDYQSLKKNVAACASASSSAIRSNHRDVEAEFPDDTSLNDSSLVGSCNGLICLLLNPPLAYYEEYYENIRLLLWNPSTRTARKVPDIDWFCFRPCYYGFGYDSTTQDYKVLLGGLSAKDGFAAIFSLKAASWKIVEDSLKPAASFGIDGRGCFLNGALHWNHRHDNGTIIRSFDFAQEKFHSFSSIRHNKCSWAGVGTTGNRLFFHTFCPDSQNFPDFEDTGLTLWVMMEYGVDQSWTIFAKIRPEIFPPNVWSLNPLFLDDGALLMESDRGDLVLCMPKEDTCRNVLDNSNVEKLRASSSSGRAVMVMYVGTLVSPATGGG
ncbi:F-box/kelch-repeat protein At3g23880-like [Pyrus communis]|uniref:F-box/kelch-repeat protein At3g23880-like n=1 Tax=Pyrus communis TaxID=23211 RepID=UPI0035C0C571